MPGLDELSDEARRNTRGRFEQWVKNPQCEANTLSAVLNVKLSDVALSLGYQPEYGQSPFAITRGLQFEGWLFKDDAKVIRESIFATTVLDLTRLGTDEEDEEAEASDRNYWLTRSSEQTIGLVDQIIKLVQIIDPLFEPKYNKPYIGIAKNGLADNFISFLPRKNHTILEFRIPRSDDISALLESAEIEVLEYKHKWGRYRARIFPDTLLNHSDLILELIKRAHGSYSEDEA